MRKHSRRRRRGGSGCGPGGCPIAPLAMRGGGAIPGPFVGAPWGTQVNQWPAMPPMSAISGNRNYLPAYDVGKDPALQMKLDYNGGRRRHRRSQRRSRRSRSHRHSRKGGSYLGDLKNSVGYNFQTAYNALSGVKAPINPSPYEDQFPRSGKFF